MEQDRQIVIISRNYVNVHMDAHRTCQCANYSMAVWFTTQKGIYHVYIIARAYNVYCRVVYSVCLKYSIKGHAVHILFV